MNLERLQQAIKSFDEVMPIGRTVEHKGRLYHIAGMTLQGDRAQLYVLAERASDGKREDTADITNRTNMKIVPESVFFMEIATLKIGERVLDTKGITGYYLGLGIHSCECASSSECTPFSECMPSCKCLDYDCEELLIFAELMKAGWSPQEDSAFARKNWEELQVIHLDFEIPEEDAFQTVPAKASLSDNTFTQRLPQWENQNVFAKTGKGSRKYLIEKPVKLAGGKEMELPFTLEDGRSGICYINRVYPMDIWKENEERFQDPRYLEIMTEEELNERKEEFFQCLEESCPRGMCYLGIEYECTLGGNLVFYDRAFLDAAPKKSTGSARIMMMLLKPDEPVGKHGLWQHGCVIQTPVAPDVQGMEAELFYYVEQLEEEEVNLKGYLC